MKKAPVLFFLSGLIFLISCGKSQDEIDLSQQIFVDYSGNFISGNGQGQWVVEDFSTREQNLFTGLDTADLSGTTKPDSVVSGTTTFPNPFTSMAAMFFSFPSGFSGQVVFKYVIVDNHLNIKNQGAIRIQSTPNASHPSSPAEGDAIHLSPDIPAGKYRIYFTLSAASNPHFYKSWGNIQKSE